MKKVIRKISLMMSMMLIFTLTTFGQFDVDVLLGIADYNFDTKKSSKIGLTFGLSINHFYFDCSANFATGKGEELEFFSWYTYDANKVSVGAINVGYNIFLTPSKILCITPIIGYGYASEIYEDSLLFPTYFYGDAKSYFNCGLIGKIRIGKIGILVGGGTFEMLKFGLSYNLMKNLF